MWLPLQDTLALASRMLPLDAYNRLAHGTFGFLNEWMMNLVTDDAVPAFNMYGLFRLADDLASIQALADASQPAGLAVGTFQATYNNRNQCAFKFWNKPETRFLLAVC